MNKTEKSFKFIPRICIFRDREEKCPVEEGLIFTARTDGEDIYQIRYVQYLRIVLAACPICGSHKSVQEIDD